MKTLTRAQIQSRKEKVVRFTRNVLVVHNHAKVIVAFDFFTVPMVAFKLLYCFFVIEHGGE